MESSNGCPELVTTVSREFIGYLPEDSSDSNNQSLASITDEGSETNIKGQEEEKQDLIAQREQTLYLQTSQLEYKGNIEKLGVVGIGYSGKVLKWSVAFKQFEAVGVEKFIQQYGMIKKEFELLRQIDHPNVIKYLYLYRAEPQNFKYREFGVLMEFMAGGNLEMWIDKNFKSITLAQKLSYMKQILSGIEYLHKLKIVHRDIKPGNILLSSDKSVIKITGFGISFQDESDSPRKRSMVGTPWYMAPEVIKGEPYSSKADIWNIGACFYHLLSGRKPYPKIAGVQGVEMISSSTPLKKSNVGILENLKMQPGIMELLESCFRSNPEERPTASDLLGNAIFKNI